MYFVPSSSAYQAAQRTVELLRWWGSAFAFASGSGSFDFGLGLDGHGYRYLGMFRSIVVVVLYKLK